MSYDFMTANMQAYGDNMANIYVKPARAGIFSGDENENGEANPADYVYLDSNVMTFVNGYASSDMDALKRQRFHLLQRWNLFILYDEIRYIKLLNLTKINT